MVEAPSLPRAMAGRCIPAVLTALILILVGCGDPAGPEANERQANELPGTLLVDKPAYATWGWLPSGDELIYATADGPGTRFEAVVVPGGLTRLVVDAPSNGDRIIGYRWQVAGEHVYYEQSYAPDRVALYTAPVSGGAGELVLDSIPYDVSVSPDERWVGWVEVRETEVGIERRVRLVDRGTAETRYFPVEKIVDRIHWSPDSRGMVVEAGSTWVADGTPFYWIDFETGETTLVLIPGHLLGESALRHFHWEEGVPYLYAAGDGEVARFSLATGDRESLAHASGVALGWSPDFSAVLLAEHSCLAWSTGPFGGDCLEWESRVERLDLETGGTTEVLEFTGPAPISGHPSPDGEWLAFEYGSCGGGCYSDGDGVYVLALP
jgi:hypothetical protein